MSDIDRERARLRQLLRGQHKSVLNRRPSNGDWSILENVRHLLFAEQLHLRGFLPRGVQWSPLGLNDRLPPGAAAVGTEPTQDIERVSDAWDKAHAPIRRAIASASGPDLERALWRNHRHLIAHIRVIQRLLKQFGASPRARQDGATTTRKQEP
jgi:hypothetical protein